MKNHPSYRLVYDLYVEDVFYYKTLQLDFRLNRVKWNGEDIQEISKITFNGKDPKNLRLTEE